MSDKYHIIRADSKKSLLKVAELDLVIFPSDERVDLSGAIWWIVYDVDGVAVGFAGVALHEHYGFLRRAGLFRRAQGRGLHKRLIQARLRYLKGICYPSAITAITYTANWNIKSANNLISLGFRLYKPRQEYGSKNALYFMHPLS